MSCSTAVTTNWTPSTSQITATSTTVVTSVSTPQPSISTTLVTSCVSTHRSTTRSRPTGRSTILNTSEIDDLTVAATRSNRNRDRDSATDEQITTTSTPSLWTLLKAATSQQDDELAKRQTVPEGLPDNCAKWTVTPSYATIAATPSTTLSTATTLTSSVTTIWQAEETVYSACPTSAESASSTETSTQSGSTTTASAAGTTQTSGSSTEVSSSEQNASSSEDSTQVSSTDPASTTSSGTWVEELSKISDMTASSQTTSAISTVSNTDSTVSVQTIDTSSNGTLIPVVLPTLNSIITDHTATPTGTSTRSRIGASTGLPPTSADAGAATQAAMAKQGDNKAVSAGAAVGGIIGMLLLIGAMLFTLRWWMRRKRGNKRKTILMRQSWYPAGYDGPDHIADTSRGEKGPSGKKREDHAKSFFSISGKGGGNGSEQPRRFPGLAMPKMPFFTHRGDSPAYLDDDQDDFPPVTADPASMPPMFSGTGDRDNENRSKFFPTLNMPWSQPKTPPVPTWAEKYVDEQPVSRKAVPVASTTFAPRDRHADVPKSILTRNEGFDTLPGPPRIDYEPAGGHKSWGLSKSAARSPPKNVAALPLANRPQLEWGHSYAASTVNPNPRHSVMPPNPRPFVPGPVLPPSPTEESVYSRRESHRSHGSRISIRHSQSRQSLHSRYSGAPDLGRKPSSRLDNSNLRSAILNRASASVASLGHLSYQSGTSDHSLPPLPEGGLRLDFPLPPSPSTRAPTLTFPTPRISVPNAHTGPTGLHAPDRPLVPSKPSIKGFVPTTNPKHTSSSIFEYADYSRTSGYNGPAMAGPSETTGRDTIRQTADWYEKPLWVWDGQSGPLPPIPDQGSQWDGQSWRHSRKSVRWDPADDVARAL